MQEEHEQAKMEKREKRELKQHKAVVLICYRCWANSKTRRSRLQLLSVLENGETDKQLGEGAERRHGVDAGGDGGRFDVSVYAEWSP